MALLPAQRNIIREIQRLHSGRAPLNISAVKRSHPKLIERVYAVRPFWGWKRALEDTGLDYAKINVELRDYVDCKICGRDLGGLSYHLINEHNMTGGDYRREYPGAEMMCEKARAKISLPRSRKRKWYTLPRWEAIWTPEYVLDRMAELHRLNFPLNLYWASNHEQSLAGKAIQYFGSWDEALRRIGLDPAQIRLARPTEHLTREQVIARLQKRRDEGLALNSAALQKEDAPLANAILKYFRFHDRALRAAGINPACVRKLKTYKPKEVAAFLAEARRIAGLRGEAHRRAWLRFKSKHFGLVAAGHRFGGWKEVAAKIGVPVERLIWRRYRNREDVMAALHQRAKQGKSLQAERVLKEDISLRTAVLKYLGSFAEVYRQFGIQPPRESRWCGADKAAIIAELRRRKKGDEPLSWKKILPTKSGPAFLERAKKLFGSWSAALGAVGIDPSHGANSPWGKANKRDILAEIRRRKYARRSLRSGTVWGEKWGQPLVRRASDLFGSWNAALRAAGIEPQGGYSRWATADKAAVLAEIRRRKRTGESLRSSKVAKEKWGRALRNRTEKLFGFWNAALRAAGIEPAKENSPWPKANKAAVLAEIRRRKRAGESLQTTKIESGKWGNPLINRTKALFGSWAAALIAAGVDLPPGLMSPWPRANKAAILAEIRRRKRAGKSLRYSKVGAEKWGSPLLARAETLFGSWNAALVAGGVELPTGVKSPWSSADRAAILVEIRRRKRAPESLRYGKVESDRGGKPLLRRANILFGSWKAAIVAVGVDLPAGVMSPWPKADKAAVLAEIRRRKRAGESLRSTKIQRERWGKPLLRRSKALFGSWNPALLAAGVDRLDLPERRRWSKADKAAVLAEIRRRNGARQSLRSSVVRQK